MKILLMIQNLNQPGPDTEYSVLTTQTAQLLPLIVFSPLCWLLQKSWPCLIPWLALLAVNYYSD